MNGLVSMFLGREFDIFTIISYLLSCALIIFVTLPLHEWAHAFVATKLGDNYPRLSGRLSFNPMVSIDYIGALCIVLFGFGWAKPVQVEMRNFRNPKRDMALTAFAGPLMNLLIAFVFTFIFALLVKFFTLPDMVYYFVLYFILLNISLAVFNMIPIPPLDGSRILTAFLPNRIYYQIMQYERIIAYVFIFLLFFGARLSFISTITNFIYKGFISLAATVVGL